MLAMAVIAGCVTAPAAQHTSPSSAARGPATIPSEAPPDSARPTVEAVAPPDVPATCQLTEPTSPFVPPAGYSAPARPPGYYNAEWYGSARLWTMLSHGGEVWFSLPHGPNGFGQKTFWWSADFDVNHEPEPTISVTGRQLDGPGRFVSPAPGTNAGADFGSAMLVGVDVPNTGCWQITATYGQASLSYVAWVGG